MIDPKQLKDNIVMPVITLLNLPSDRPSDGKASCELLMGTAMQESRLQWLIQLGGGPAVGLWQMEPATYDWLRGWMATQSAILATVTSLGMGTAPAKASQMAGNLYLACAMARLRYYVVADPLPTQGDYLAQAKYYKQYYNTPAGAATVQQYLDSWNLIRGKL